MSHVFKQRSKGAGSTVRLCCFMVVFGGIALLRTGLCSPGWQHVQRADGQAEPDAAVRFHHRISYLDSRSPAPSLGLGNSYLQSR
jgi:hypothetical protein